MKEGIGPPELDFKLLNFLTASLLSPFWLNIECNKLAGIKETKIRIVCI